jgi:serine O-acetyltransferase
MDWLQLIDDLWRDFDRLARMGARPSQMLIDPGVWAVATYRMGRALLSLPRAMRAPLILVHRPVEMAVQLITGVKLPLSAEIGGGLFLAHTGGIAVSQDAHIGRDCNLSRGAHIGGAPFIGDRVYIGPGARIAGEVRVGNDAAVGANAVVDADVPDGCVMGSTAPLRLVLGRKRPPAFDQPRGFLRTVLPRPTQLLLRAG